MFTWVLSLLLSASFLVQGYVGYWGFFLLSNILFTVLMRLYRVHSIVLYNYVGFQEMLGYLFLWNLYPWLPTLLLFFKVGVPPLHFWIFVLVENLSGYVFLWFLTYHKLVFVPCLVTLVGDQSALLMFGLCLLYLQIYLVSSYRSLLTLLSLESFSWMLLLITTSLSTAWYIFVLYFFSIILALGNLRGSSYLGLPFILSVMGFPLTLGFFIKYFALSSTSESLGLGLLLPLVLSACSVTSALYLVFTLALTVSIEAVSPSNLLSFILLLIIYFVMN